MRGGPATRPSLLVRIRDHADRTAWAEFVGLYVPLVYGYARARGLQEADAADLVQEVFRSVAAAVRRFDYDPQRGGFRAWLLQATRNHLRSFLRRAARAARVGLPDGATILEDLPAAEGRDDLWEMEWRRHVFA